MRRTVFQKRGETINKPKTKQLSSPLDSLWVSPFEEALLSLLDEKTIKEQTKLLEGLKSELRDWETIDSKIDDINSKASDFKVNHKVNQLLEKYADDEEMLIQVVEEQSKRVSDVELLQSYKDTFSSVKLTPDTLERISEIYSQRISENG